MNRQELEALETDLMAEVVKRRALGGYSHDAAAILMLGEIVMRLLRHEIEKSAPVKKK